MSNECSEKGNYEKVPLTIAFKIRYLGVNLNKGSERLVY
jgi:hypothetical protein